MSPALFNDFLSMGWLKNEGKNIANGDEEFYYNYFTDDYPVELDWASGSLDELVRKQ